MDQPIPILLTVRDLHHGGIARDVRNIAIHIERSRFTPHVATYDARGMRFDELHTAGVPVLQIPSPSRKTPLRTLTAAVQLRGYIQRQRIRILHAFDTTAVLTVPLARLSGVPVVISSQLTSRQLLTSRGRSYLRRTDRMVNAVVVNCEALKGHLRDDERVPSECIEICYSGVDVGEFHVAGGVRPSGLAVDGLLVGTVSVLRPEKALHILQDAFARIRHLHPRLRLLIVGSGSELMHLQRTSERHNLQDYCTFLPSTPRVAPLLRVMDIFVVCSESEGLPNALLEAMACGCSVVASRVGGIPEVIGENERGLLFRPGDPFDLAEKLATLIGDTAFRQALASRAARFVAEHFSLTAGIDRLAQLYLALLAKREKLRAIKMTEWRDGGANQDGSSPL